MPTKQSPIRTIRRRKEWPAWAKWYAVDAFTVARAYVYSDKPVRTKIGDSVRMWDIRRISSRYQTVERVGSAPRDWRSPLRRIAGKVRP